MKTHVALPAEMDALIAACSCWALRSGRWLFSVTGGGGEACELLICAVATATITCNMMDFELDTPYGQRPTSTMDWVAEKVKRSGNDFIKPIVNRACVDRKTTLRTNFQIKIKKPQLEGWGETTVNNNDGAHSIVIMGGAFTFYWNEGCNTEPLHRTRVYTRPTPKLGRKNESIGELCVQQDRNCI